MDIEGSMIHQECGGTGFRSLEDNVIDVCVECMGSGMIKVDLVMGDHVNWVTIKE